MVGSASTKHAESGDISFWGDFRSFLIMSLAIVVRTEIRVE